MIKEEKPVTKLLIENAKQILTMQGESNHDVGMLEGGSIYIEGNLIKAIAGLVGGGGGGRPNMAQAGGKNPSGIAAALEKAAEVVAEQVK